MLLYLGAGGSPDVWVTLWGEAGSHGLVAACGRCSDGSLGSPSGSCHRFGLVKVAWLCPWVL